MPEALVGRQPIYDRDLEVYGYELLFRRDPAVNQAEVTDGDAATSQVILNTFHEIGMEEVVGRRHAFINLTRGFIVGEYPLPVPTENVVLEVLEHVEPDDDVLRGLADLAGKGYTIALDDFVLSDRTRPFLPFATLAKLDIDALDRVTLGRNLSELRELGLKVVAEQVRTARDFEECLEMGFDLYQGFFLSKPNIVRGRRVPANRLGVLRVLSRIMDPHCDLDELENLIGQDVILSYKLLRTINSAAYGMPREIQSVRETVVYLGRESIRNLAGLFILSGLDDRPHALVVSAMLRGRMCELLAVAGGSRAPEAYFATGMFSTLGALLECSMRDVVAQLPLAPAIAAALLDREGELGTALGCVLAYECGDWENVSFGALGSSEIKDAFLGAVQWTESVDRELSRAA